MSAVVADLARAAAAAGLRRQRRSADARARRIDPDHPGPASLILLRPRLAALPAPTARTRRSIGSTPASCATASASPAIPNLAPDTEPALFGSLQETVGRQINEHAGADPRAWAATMERALAWDAATRNGFEPKAPCRAAIADQRGGMGGLIAHVRQNEAQIRRDRAAAGLPQPLADHVAACSRTQVPTRRRGARRSRQDVDRAAFELQTLVERIGAARDLGRGVPRSLNGQADHRDGGAGAAAEHPFLDCGSTGAPRSRRRASLGPFPRRRRLPTRRGEMEPVTAQTLSRDIPRAPAAASPRQRRARARRRRAGAAAS